MEVIYGLESFPRQRVPVVAALGTFDGVHRGHRALIELAVGWAGESGGRCAAVTFDPHPWQVIAPPAEPFLLTTLDERLSLLAGLGVDLAGVVKFTSEFRQIPAEEWIDLLLRHTAMAGVVCGPNYTFGRDRTGTVRLLQTLATRRSFEVRVAPLIKVAGTLVSSTAIRELIRTGGVRQAAELLGRWYAIRGEVIRGDERGKSLGFPTANMLPPRDKVCPAAGIYGAFARTGRAVYPAAVSIGTRPTFGAGRLLVEAFLIDYHGDLFGEPLELRFVQRLRDEVAFPSVETLVQQMHADVAEARALLAAVRPDEPESTRSTRSTRSNSN